MVVSLYRGVDAQTQNDIIVMRDTAVTRYVPYLAAIPCRSRDTYCLEVDHEHFLPQPFRSICYNHHIILWMLNNHSS
jgi:hypothetical protein